MSFVGQVLWNLSEIGCWATWIVGAAAAATPAAPMAAFFRNARREAFTRLLGNDGPAYVPRARFGATDAIDARGGDPVAAIREITGGGAHYAFDAYGSPRTMEQAIALNTPHLSCYGLTYEPNTPIAVKKRRKAMPSTTCGIISGERNSAARASRPRKR